MYKYSYFRYGAPFSREYKTKEDALRRAIADFDLNEAYPESIVDAEGNVLYDHDAIVDACFAADSEPER